MEINWGGPLTSYLGSIYLLERLTEGRERFTCICLFIVKDIIKETDEKTNRFKE